MAPMVVRGPKEAPVVLRAPSSVPASILRQGLPFSAGTVAGIPATIGLFKYDDSMPFGPPEVRLSVLNLKW
jgi:hypothetical protein